MLHYFAVSVTVATQFPRRDLKSFILFNFPLSVSEHTKSLFLRRAQSLSPTDHLAAFYLALQLAVSRQVT